jgi:hypothetical protein
VARGGEMEKGIAYIHAEQEGLKKLLLARGGKLISTRREEIKKILEIEWSSSAEYLISLPIEKCAGIEATPFAVKVVFEKKFPVAETTDGVKIRSNARYDDAAWEIDDDENICFVWQQKENEPFPSIANFVNLISLYFPMSSSEKKAREEEEGRQREEEDKRRKKEEEVRKKANFSEWQEDLTKYQVLLEEELVKIKPVLTRKYSLKSYEAMKEAYHSDRLQFPDCEDC